MFGTTLKDYVRVYKRRLDSAFCKEVVIKISKESWSKHSFYDSTANQLRTFNTDLSVNYADIEERKTLDDVSVNAFRSYLDDMKDMAWFRQLDGHSSIRFNRYDPSTQMRTHCDHIKLLFDGERKGIPVLSAVGALNESYVGGDFIMCGEKIDLKTGDILVFPSNFLYPHGVTPVKSGIRYSFVSWAW